MIKIGFALITAPPMFNKIVDIENNLHDTVNFHNKLGLTNNIPHTTLFQGTFKDDTNYIEIANNIAKFYKKNCIDHYLHFTSVVYIPRGWYFYTCELTDELHSLHNVVLANSQEYIILEPDRLQQDSSELTQCQLHAITNYGYKYAADAFFPHITLGRTDKDM
jgi:hypothetical protein